VIRKIEEELQEFYDEVDRNDKQSAEAEFGDLLFSMINYARFIGINPDDALSKTNQKFRNRFVKMEIKISDRQLNMSQFKLDDWEKLWQEVKSEK
jgi:XTP/dITP diphosphohydrolase